MVPMRTTTNVSSSSTMSVTVLKRRCTSLPDSENQRENNECELISINLECGYLHNPRTFSNGSETNFAALTGLRGELTVFELEHGIVMFFRCRVVHEVARHGSTTRR